MKRKEFLKLVEIQTKVASILPMIIGFLYSRFSFGSFRGFASLLFFLSLLSLDMGTTALNHYSDYKKEKIGKGYGYEEHNPLSAYGLKQSKVRAVIVLLFLFSFVLGLLLVGQSDYMVLLLGLFSGLIAIVYSKGPIPISHTPFGEIVSGFLMGGVIFFIAVYIQNPQESWILYEGGGRISLQLDILIQIIFVSLPLVLGIGNIMLANNICDMKEDMDNGRHTLVSYIGKEKALMVFGISQILILLLLFIQMLSKLFPWTGILVFLSAPLLYINTKRFIQNPTKDKTFVSSVKNFVLVASLMALALVGALFW